MKFSKQEQAKFNKGVARSVKLAECSNSECKARFDTKLTNGKCPRCGNYPKRG
jgi:hypothetical protein